jgi:DNA-binding MarR family transcriptional regulator
MPDKTNDLTKTLQDWVEVFMHRSMRYVFLFTKEHNLSMSQMGALLNIHRQGVCSVSDIGDELGVTSAAASQMLERLVQQELIARSEDPHDRRGKQIVLTDKGRQVIQDSFHARQSWLGDLAQTLTPAEQESVIAALTLLIEKIKQWDEVAE